MASRPLPSKCRVLIVGTGLDAAMSAAVLARSLPTDRYAVSIVGTEGDQANFGPIEATLPSICRLHEALSLREDEVMKSTSASFSLGVAYSGWSGDGKAYFAPFSDIGSSLWGVPFHHLVQRLRAAGERIRLADYSVAAMLAQTSRFAHPLTDPRSTLSTYSYALHLECQAYSNLLFSLAETAGAVRVESRFATIQRSSDGRINAIDCADGRRLEADIFVDASGPAALLSAGSGGFISWSEWLPWNSVVEFECRSDRPPAPYSLVTAERFGWRRSVPGGDRLGECLVYDSNEMSDEGARDRILQVAIGRPASEPRVTRFHSGRLAEPWQANCISIGGAAAMLEPSAATPLHLLQAQLERLVNLFPSQGPCGVLRREYNRLTCQELDRTRDFVILRYKLNGRSGEPRWDQLRAMPVPDELGHKMNQYASRARVPLLDGDFFEESDWALLFDEHGVTPQRYDVLADTVPADHLKSQLSRMRQLMAAAVRSVPPHDRYLAQIQHVAVA